MPDINRQEWYEQYLLLRAARKGRPANKRTVVRMYMRHWKHLIIASQAQMGICSTCEKLKEIRRKAVLPEQRDRAAAAQSAHVAAVLKDRRVDALVQGKAEESIMASNPGSPWAETILNWDQDWMDQAKFRCPRNASMNKQFADMWRPQLGAGGVTMDGIGSFILLTDLDLGKMQMSN